MATLGIEGCHERVTVDRNRITGGGVTAGVDFGLTVIAELNTPRVIALFLLALQVTNPSGGAPLNPRMELLATWIRVPDDSVWNCPRRAGGNTLEVGSTRDLAPAFLEILDEFRQRYVISFSPEGVPAPGWHPLQVRVRNRRVAVKARPGYVKP